MVKKKTTPKRKKVLLSSFNDGQGGSGQHNKISQRVDVALPNTTNTNIKPNDNDGQDGPSSSSSSLLALSSSVVGGMESSSSSSLQLPLSSLPLPPLPPIGKFQKTERKQTNHEKELYCVAWSDDSYVKERNSNKSKQSTTSGDDDNKGDGEQQVRYYVFATCGANKVSLYEVQVNNNPNSNNNKSSNNNNKGMELLTCYTDNDTHEAFFACVFGGRSKMSYHQLQKNNNNDNHYHSSSSTVDNHDDDDDDDLQRQNSHIDSSTSNFSGSTSASNNNKTTTTTTTSCSSSNNDVQTEVGKKRPRTMEESVYTVGGHHRSSQQHQKRQFELDHYYPQLLCVAGQSGRIKVIDPVQGKIIVQLYGHGHEIYDLRISPTNEYHMLSASVDESIRLWNLQSFACVAIFTGQHGHKEAV